MEDSNRMLVGTNMTEFFRRELRMYGFGDIKFQKPVSLKKAAYVVGYFLIWSLPIFYYFGLHMNPFYIGLLVLPPIVMGHYSTKPIFSGKTLPQFIKSMWHYSQEPSGWSDLKNNSRLWKSDVFFVQQEIWISRRRELRLLKKLKAERKAEQKTARRRK